MSPVSLPAVAPTQEIPHLAALIMVVVAAGARVRVILCVLAAFAVHKALSDPSEESAAIRTYRLAVLQAILGALTRQASLRPAQRPPATSQQNAQHDTDQASGGQR